MGKIVVSMWTTLDGYVAGPQDEMDWLLIDDQLLRYEQELVESSDSLLLGRITHGDFAGYWPRAADDPAEPDEVRAYARRIDAMDKIVISASGNTAPWKNTRRFERIDPDEITELKRGTGGDIVIYGSLAVIRALAGHRLIDEFQLLVHPVLLGHGKALLDQDQSPARLELLSAKPFPSGVVLMKYRPAHNIPATA
ncbi:dihydrofolate reductase family protein [Jiangella alkaliphila]|uniref:Dihydrofolate reductase n=1 Tax=Jiangella alkaliphila TaxID=419479 RepID=A0A1H2LFS7_9ACTN|nr:dihydrofolate reductase family protein [Jiangella alkaliphila]SDU79441.1 Dihydrofolate reductase [Jiangella alkaliphila]